MVNSRSIARLGTLAAPTGNLLYMWKIREIFRFFLHSTKPNLKLNIASVSGR
jgi:hypothetical protein